ncbi:MAG: twin-arginine translocation signal domain-containing protein, partial [Flavobacterium sp.]
MSNRRDFIKKTALGTLAVSSVLGYSGFAKNTKDEKIPETEDLGKKQKKPIIISTWNHGLPANEETWKQLKDGKPALDALEAGMKIP